MATSGSINYTLTAAQVVNEAMSLLGVKTPVNALSSEDMAEGLSTLNLMLKTFAVRLHRWLMTEGTIAPLLATASYALAIKAHKVISIRRRVSNLDTPLIALSREEYYALPSKAATGTPNSYYYDPQLATGTVYLSPTPDAGFVANGTLRMTYTRVIEDVDAAANNLDIPVEWLEACIYNLADRLAAKYPAVDPTERGMIAARAKSLFETLTWHDQEDTSLFFQPG